MVRQINNLKKRDPNSEDAALLQTQLQSYKVWIIQVL